jgi:hypothetical protein
LWRSILRTLEAEILIEQIADIETEDTVPLRKAISDTDIGKNELVSAGVLHILIGVSRLHSGIEACRMMEGKREGQEFSIRIGRGFAFELLPSSTGGASTP